MSKRTLCLVYGLCAVLITIVAVMGILGCASETVAVDSTDVDTVHVTSGVCIVCTQDTMLIYLVSDWPECRRFAEFYDTTECAYIEPRSERSQ